MVNVVKKDGTLYTMREFETALAQEVVARLKDREFVTYTELCDIAAAHGLKTAMQLKAAMNEVYGNKKIKSINRVSVSGWWLNE